MIVPHINLLLYAYDSASPFHSKATDWWQTCLMEPQADHVAHVLKLLETLGTAGNFVTDAQLAALAIEQGAVLQTADSDFLRFRGLRWLNPIAGVASRGLSRSRRS